MPEVEAVLRGEREWALVQGDARELLPLLPAGDGLAVVTDPPYGVGFTGKAAKYRNRPHFKKNETYGEYEDTEENWFTTVLPAIKLCVERFPVAVFFMADFRLFDMPRGGSVGGIFLPNGCGKGRWGFQCINHVC